VYGVVIYDAVIYGGGIVSHGCDFLETMCVYLMKRRLLTRTFVRGE
jgi:hypothetical protein